MDKLSQGRLQRNTIFRNAAASACDKGSQSYASDGAHQRDVAESRAAKLHPEQRSGQRLREGRPKGAIAAVSAGGKRGRSMLTMELIDEMA